MGERHPAAAAVLTVAGSAFAEPVTIRFGFARVGVGNRQFGSGNTAALLHSRDIPGEEFRNDPDF